MIFCIFAILGFVVLVMCWGEPDDSPFTDSSTMTGFGFGCAFVLVVIGTMIALGASAIWGEAKDRQVIDSHENIVTLGDGLGSRGEFRAGLFFTTGSIKSTIYWSWYERDENGVITAQTINNSDDDVEIIEQPEGTEPRVDRVSYEEEYATTPWWAAPFPINGHEPPDDVTWKLYVPEGSFVTGVRLDAE